MRILAVLPLEQLKAVQAVRTPGGENVLYMGQLRLIRDDGRIWARLTFPSEHEARKARQEILAWLGENLPPAAATD